MIDLFINAMNAGNVVGMVLIGLLIFFNKSCTDKLTERLTKLETIIELLIKERTLK